MASWKERHGRQRHRKTNELKSLGGAHGRGWLDDPEEWPAETRVHVVPFATSRH